MASGQWPRGVWGELDGQNTNKTTNGEHLWIFWSLYAVDRGGSDPRLLLLSVVTSEQVKCCRFSSSSWHQCLR